MFITERAKEDEFFFKPKIPQFPPINPILMFKGSTGDNPVQEMAGVENSVDKRQGYNLGLLILHKHAHMHTHPE